MYVYLLIHIYIYICIYDEHFVTIQTHKPQLLKPSHGLDSGMPAVLSNVSSQHFASSTRHTRYTLAA